MQKYNIIIESRLLPYGYRANDEHILAKSVTTEEFVTPLVGSPAGIALPTSNDERFTCNSVYVSAIGNINKYLLCDLTFNKD